MCVYTVPVGYVQYVSMYITLFSLLHVSRLRTLTSSFRPYLVRVCFFITPRRDYFDQMDSFPLSKSHTLTGG